MIRIRLINLLNANSYLSDLYTMFDGIYDVWAYRTLYFTMSDSDFFSAFKYIYIYVVYIYMYIFILRIYILSVYIYIYMHTNLAYY